METEPAPWIQALRASHDTLRGLVEPLDVVRLQGRSYASEWSIAQVASHLGSQAEIFDLFLDAGLNGTNPPGREAFEPIWEAWNARDPQAQAADALRADGEVVERFESLSDEQVERLHLELFGMDLDATGLARMRLSEHAVHTWDIAVALDPNATLAPDATVLLVDALDQVVGRSAKPDGTARSIHVSTTAPQREFALQLSESVSLVASGEHGGGPEIALPAEAFIRLVYGRLDSAHTPTITTDGLDIDELRAIFPGF